MPLCRKLGSSVKIRSRMCRCLVGLLTTWSRFRSIVRSCSSWNATFSSEVPGAGSAKRDPSESIQLTIVGGKLKSPLRMMLKSLPAALFFSVCCRILFRTSLSLESEALGGGGAIHGDEGCVELCDIDNCQFTVPI